MDNTIILHYGVKRRSGRYPWGSGGELISLIEGFAAKGMTELEIAKSLGISTTDLRSQKSLAKSAEKEARRLHVVQQRERGMSESAISKETGIPESTVRDLLKPTANLKFRIIKGIADVLRMAIEKYNFIDIGAGVETFLGVSSTKLKHAVALLRNEGYTIHYVQAEQLGTGKKTTVKVLAAPGVEYKDVIANKDKIAIPNHYSEDDGHSFVGMKPITNINSGRIQINYAETGGGDRDGLIELRQGVPEMSLGHKRYAQVRIGVDGTHYLKGMAVYKDNMPPGVDVIFHTTKTNSGNRLDALKKQELDMENPFGTTVKQRTFMKDGVEMTSALNLVYEEGEWNDWSKNLSSQLLSKQSPRLAKAQLDLAYDRRLAEYKDILDLDNPEVRKHLLAAFADSSDSAAVHLQAASLPRQTTAVLLPEPTMKVSEIYAPNHKNGEQVVLVRYPHGGPFEIPSLTVNNKNPNAKAILGAADDAVAIHPEVAKRLSGADFDGDTVLVIPNNKGLIKTSPALRGLENFDPQMAYPNYEGMKVLTPTGKQLKMGDVSNLITDMHIKGAGQAELAQAVRHSMVVIDAEKHKLNWKQSHLDNGIPALKTKYQGSARGGASTLISRSSSQAPIPQRRDSYSIDPKTGEKVFTVTGKTYVNKKGVEVYNITRSTKGYEAPDAHTLSSGTVIEKVYATHANKMKALGDRARLSLVQTQPSKYSPSAKTTYSKQVDSLSAKLRLAQRNQPLERKAQLVAKAILDSKRANSPAMSKADLQKERGRSLIIARSRIGAKKPLIEITPREWQAIQMGALTPTRLTQILRNADMDKVKALATPRTTQGLSSGQTLRAKTLLAAGYSNAEVASAIGGSVSQINNIDGL